MNTSEQPFGEVLSLADICGFAGPGRKGYPSSVSYSWHRNTGRGHKSIVWYFQYPILREARYQTGDHLQVEFRPPADSQRIVAFRFTPKGYDAKIEEREHGAVAKIGCRAIEMLDNPELFPDLGRRTRLMVHKVSPSTIEVLLEQA